MVGCVLPRRAVAASVTVGFLILPFLVAVRTFLVIIIDIINSEPHESSNGIVSFLPFIHRRGSLWRITHQQDATGEGPVPPLLHFRLSEKQKPTNTNTLLSGLKLP